MSWRFEFAEKAWLIADAIYRQIWNEDIIINRHTGDILDIEFATDVSIVVPMAELKQLSFSLQEKFRTPQKQTFQDVTIEFEQDFTTQELGDLSKLCVDYYVYGYTDSIEPTQFLEFHVLRMVRLKELLFSGSLPYTKENNLHDGAKASFIAIKFKDIPDDCWFWKSTEIKTPFDWGDLW